MAHSTPYEIVKARLLQDPETARAYARLGWIRTYCRLRIWLHERLCSMQARLDRYGERERREKH